MPPPCTPFQETQIRIHLEAGVPKRNIGPMINPPVSYSKVLKAARFLRVFDSTTPPALVPRGQPRKITSEMSKALASYLLNKPSLYIDEMAWYLYEEFGVYISYRTVQRWLRTHKYTKKKLERRAMERNPQLRDWFRRRQAFWQSRQIVAIDESAANEYTKDRRFGWSLQGVPPVEFLPANRSTRWSMLPAYTVDGYIAYEVLQGAYTAELFNTFIRDRVLPFCNPYPHPERSILLMDNARIHRNEELKDMCREAGVLLVYHPPYSPDFNPIELSFSELKGWMRRNRELAGQYGDNFLGFLHLALRSSGNHAVAHFRKCFFNTEDVE